MSRIGKKTIPSPAASPSTIEGQTVSVKGPKGELCVDAWPTRSPSRTTRRRHRRPRSATTPARAARCGACRARLVANMVQGVTQGFEQMLELVGVGYRAAMKGSRSAMQLGFSHDVDYPPPAGITFAAPRRRVAITGIDKQLVGETAARIRKIRPPEPYKGKGVRYAGEKVRRKEGKKK